MGKKVNGVEKRELNLRFSSRKSKLTLKKKKQEIVISADYSEIWSKF